MPLEAPLMTACFTLQAPTSHDLLIRAELAAETFTDLDRARDVALGLCQELGLDIEIVRSFGAASCVWEVYDAATYD